jgi:hypothetical protein
MGELLPVYNKGGRICVLKLGGEKMASSLELQIAQRDKLYDLLELEKAMENEKDTAGYKVLQKQIRKTKAIMQAEDVAYVEKMLAED